MQRQFADDMDDDPRVEADRLRTLLDKLPSCLMRVGVDGTLLAVSDTARDLLGARDLGAALGSNFIDRLRGDASAVWGDFAQRVSHDGSGSAECEMEDLAGVRRVVVLQGVAVPHHPDTHASVLVAVRDISTARRLEASLHEQESARRSVQAALDAATASLEQLRGQLENVSAERRELRAALDGMVADQQRVGAAIDQLITALSVAMDAASSARQVLISKVRR